jgi:hypothetical protein
MIYMLTNILNNFFLSPYGEEDDDDETANNGEDEEYSDGLPRVGHAHDENYDESVDSGDEMMVDFFEDDFVINDRANAMDPVLLIAAAKNKLVPIERKGVVRRRDESQLEDEAEINDLASPNKRRRLDDGYVDDKVKKSNRNEYNDILPALMGEGNNNGSDGDGKRDDKKLNDIWNGKKSKSPKNRPNKEKNNNGNNNNNNDEDDMPALVEDIDDDEPAQRYSVRNRGNENNTRGTNRGGSDNDMPILIDSDDEDDYQPGHSTQTDPITVNADEESLPELTSEEESDDEAPFMSGFPVYSRRTCPVHSARPTCCPHHEEQGFITDDDESESDDSEDEDMEDDEDERVTNIFRNFLHEFGGVAGQQRTSQSSSASSSLRQESPFLRGGASPTVAHHLHGSLSSVPGQRRRRVDKDREEYNEDYEVDLNKPVDVPPLVWSDDESGYVFIERSLFLGRQY